MTQGAVTIFAAFFYPRQQLGEPLPMTGGAITAVTAFFRPRQKLEEPLPQSSVSANNWGSHYCSFFGSANDWESHL